MAAHGLQRGAAGRQLVARRAAARPLRRRLSAADRGARAHVRRAQGIATIVDLHQDAWGPTLAAPAGTSVGRLQLPALGWDGAPGWATLVGASTPRCTSGELRESSPAVLEAWSRVLGRRAGPGGVGIQTRYARDARATSRARSRAGRGVVGYDVMNEPGAIGDEQNAALSRFYARAVRAMRAGERAAAAIAGSCCSSRPSLWSATGSGAPPRFAADRDVVYAPHIYTGGFDGRADHARGVRDRARPRRVPSGARRC